MTRSRNTNSESWQRLFRNWTVDLINSYINGIYLSILSDRFGLALLYISGALVILGSVATNQFQSLEKVTLGIFIVSGVCLIFAVWLYNSLKNKKGIDDERDSKLLLLSLLIMAGYLVSFIAYLGVLIATIMLIVLIWQA